MAVANRTATDGSFASCAIARSTRSAAEMTSIGL